jgi:hypothetical protein
MARPAKSFPHRRNPDGSYDSICTDCLATVATVQNEDQLRQYERTHTCDTLRLYEMNESRIATNLRMGPQMKNPPARADFSISSCADRVPSNAKPVQRSLP